MRKENRKDAQCCNKKDQKNLEFARELSNVERCNEKDCGGGCGGKR